MRTTIIMLTPNEPTRADNIHHVVISSGVDSTAVLDGFIITAGNANDDGGGDVQLQ